MKHLKNFILIMTGTMLLLGSCVQDELEVNESTIFPGSQALVQTTLFGTVVDKHDEPIQNAQIIYRSGRSAQTVTTDEFGNFLLEDITNKGSSAFLQIEYAGKFDAFRRFGVLEGRYNRTVIKMQDKTIVGQVSASDGGRVIDANGAYVDLPANGIIDARGQSYSGPVDVAMAWIDPTSEDLPEIMVGDLSGIDLDGNQSALTTYGMLQVELQDPSGNELNLAEGQTAELGFPVPASLRGGAKETAPLWIYDEDLGTWIEENTANYENGMYVGRVPHFSSFNIDFKGEVIEITGQVQWDVPGDTLNGSYLQVFVCSERIGNRGGWLCDDGSFRFYNFPKDEEFTVKVKDACGQVLNEEDFGPFAESTDLGDIMVNFGINNVVISGTAVDCDNYPVSQGLVQVRTEGRLLTFPVDNGEFNFSVDLCDGDDGEIVIIDPASQIQSDIITIDNSSNVLALGEIELCDVLSEFIEFTIDGTMPFIFTNNIDYNEVLSGMNTFGRIGVANTNSPDSLDGRSLTMSFLNIPTSPSMNVTADSDFQFFSLNGSFYYYSEQEAIRIEFELFDAAIGGRMKGTFSGLISMERGGGQDDLPIEGSFDFTVK